MITSLAWRNIWRNKKRSFLLIITVVLGVWALLIAMSFVNGQGKSFVENAINTEYSHIQVHDPRFKEDLDPSYTIQDGNALMQTLDTMPGIQHHAKRAKMEGVIMSPHSSAVIEVFGIDPPAERKLTGLDQFLVEGDFLGDSSLRRVLIGQKLASKLNVKLNSRVIVTFMNTNKEITSEVLRVGGLLKTHSGKINESRLYISHEDFQDIYGEKPVVHEIAILLSDINQSGKVAGQIEAISPGTLVETWIQLAPMLEVSIQQTRQNKLIVLIVIILAFSFGIVNTMLMQVTERTREIGMLKANGMSRGKIFAMINLESFFTVSIATLVGIMSGYVVIQFLTARGFDFSRYSEAMESMGWPSVIYPFLEQHEYFIVLTCAVLSGILGASYPALKAILTNPVTAMQRKY